MARHARVLCPSRALPLAFLLIGACQPPAPTLFLAPCTETGDESEVVTELLCGQLPVAENRQSEGGRRIELAVVVAPAIEPREDAAPMFVLEGGPGIAASNGAGLFVGAGAPYRRHRDVVMVDLRGTGGSHPLHCPSLEGRGVRLERHLDVMYPLDEVEACRDQLTARADLTRYTTADGVEDLEAVREALGYESIVLQGVSYGTRLALEYLRRYPRRVRSFIGIGTLSPEHVVPLRHAQGFQRSFDRLLEDCESDESCRGAYPDLRERWLDLLARLAAAPALYRHTPESGGAEVELSIRRDVLVSKLRSTLYFASAGRALPRVIDAASRGDFGPYLELALPSEPDPPPFLAEGAYLSITCTEDVSRIEEEMIPAHTDGTYLGDYRVRQQLGACGIWPAGEIPADHGTPVVSSVPALLITGERDPVTPPADARAVVSTLEHGRVLVVPHGGHLPFDGSDPLCVDGIVLDFLEKNDAFEVDASCLEKLESLPFPGA